VHSFKEPIDSKRLKLISTCHFLLKSDVRGSDTHKHSHFTDVGKSRQRIKVLVQGESITLSSQMVGKTIFELMHQEDATCDLISCSPGQHDLLLQCVRSPPLPYLQGLEQLMLSNLQPILVLHAVNYTKWNAIYSPSVLWNSLHPLRTWFNAHFRNINNILKTIRTCQMLTGCYIMKRINSDPILSLWSLGSLFKCQSVVDMNFIVQGYPLNTLWFPLTKWH
jgi:hypothetical protein